MACNCCKSGRCCQGSACSTKTKASCTKSGGEFTLDATCAELTCTAGCTNPCKVTNFCDCKSRGGTLLAISSCDCNALSAAGVSNGGCCSTKCEVCGSGGSCVSNCPSPRTCCNGTCLPITKKCVNGQGVDKCAETFVFCSAGPESEQYSCCNNQQKCCGAEGCKDNLTDTQLRILATIDQWTNTGIVVTDTITIRASGSVKYGLGSNQTASPRGMDNEECFIEAFCFGSYSTKCPKYAATPVPDVCHAALVARVGSNITFATNSFYRGSPGTGLLWLRVNDSSVSDNSGYFDVTITATQDPCPNYTPASVGDPIVYPAQPTLAAQTPPDSPKTTGPGVELKALLKMAGIVSSPTCSCNSRARQMDEWGEFTCLKRLPEITGWLGDEAKKRDLWFFPPAGVALILLAISLAALKRLWKGINR